MSYIHLVWVDIQCVYIYIYRYMYTCITYSIYCTHIQYILAYSMYCLYTYSMYLCMGRHTCSTG